MNKMAASLLIELKVPLDETVIFLAENPILISDARKPSWGTVKSLPVETTNE